MARVLHIEDDRSSRVLVRKLLGAAGHEVIDAETGLQGIRMADSQRPDLVLVDINVPDLDGYEVTLRLRGIPALEHVPIVAITAEGDRETSLAVGADGFLTKPINAAQFPAQIRRFLAGHREQARDRRGHRLRSRSQKLAERLERKVAELSEANQRLEEMARLRSEFLRNISHEFATPMTPVVGYLRLLLDEEVGPLTQLQRKSLSQIHESTERLQRLIDTLLDLSTLETGRMHVYERDYDFCQVAARALDEIRSKCVRAKIDVVEQLPEEPLPARGDPDKLRRAMAHILDNAVKFTPRGGQMAIGVEVDPADDRLLFSVADSGPGIPAKDMHKVFEAFFQVDGSPTRKYGGVGVGLAFARRVAEALGGSVQVQSPPKQPVAGRMLRGTQAVMSVRRMPAPASGASPSTA